MKWTWKRGCLASQPFEAKGRDELIAFFERSNEFVRISLVPRVIIVNPGICATELDCFMRAERELPDFLLGPLEKEGEATMRMAAVYHLAQDRISRARIYWRRRIA